MNIVSVFPKTKILGLFQSTKTKSTSSQKNLITLDKSQTKINYE